MPPPPPPPGGKRPNRRVSIGVVDDKFLAQQKQARQGAASKSATNEVTLSQARSKALARLGASESGMGTQFASGGPGGRRRRKREPLLPDRFNDPEVEEEYTLTAYLMHRAFIVWMLLLFALAYTIVGVVTLIGDLSGTPNASGATVASGAAGAAAALRGAAVFLCVLIAALVLSNRLSLRAVHL